MAPTLPRGIARKLRAVRTLSLALGALLSGAAACKHVVTDQAVQPGPPIPAEPDTDLENMDTECAGLVAALARYGECPNLEDADRQWTRRTIEVAEQSFAAGKKANPDEPSQKAIAAACHRATRSIHYATERCHAGKRPKVD
jgi:hypothetical protein